VSELKKRAVGWVFCQNECFCSDSCLQQQRQEKPHATETKIEQRHRDEAVSLIPDADPWFQGRIARYLAEQEAATLAEAQRVSEIAKEALAEMYAWGNNANLCLLLQSLILPDPEPTPEEVLAEAMRYETGTAAYAHVKTRGYELRKIG